MIRASLHHHVTPPNNLSKGWTDKLRRHGLVYLSYSMLNVAQESDVNPLYLLNMYLWLTYWTGRDFSCHVTREYVDYCRLESTIVAIRTFELTQPVIVSGRDAKDCYYQMSYGKGERTNPQFLDEVVVHYISMQVLIQNLGLAWRSKLEIHMWWMGRFHIKSTGGQLPKKFMRDLHRVFLLTFLTFQFLWLQKPTTQQTRWLVAITSKTSDTVIPWYPFVLGCKCVIDQVRVQKSMGNLRLCVVR